MSDDPILALATTVARHCGRDAPDSSDFHSVGLVAYRELAEVKARLAAVEAECADLIAGKEYQAMQRTLVEVNARLALSETDRGSLFARLCETEARLAEAERVLRICANYPPAGMRPQDAKGFFKGFIPTEQRAAREYFAARAADSTPAGYACMNCAGAGCTDCQPDSAGEKL